MSTSFYVEKDVFSFFHTNQLVVDGIKSMVSFEGK